MKIDFSDIDRRIIYGFMIIVVSIPLIFGYTLTPARMEAAEKLYNIIDSLEREESKIAFVAFDFGPNTKAENQPQAEVVVEHLLRKRIPFAVFSQYALAEGFLTLIPEKIVKRLVEENSGESWEYGKDWVNLGYRPGSSIFIQGLAKSDNIPEYLGKDAFGTDLATLEVFRGVKTLEDVNLLAEFTGLVGAFDVYIQFFQREGYLPLFGHGCTSITIPEAYIYLDSGQLTGLLEGLAGAAWYSEMLKMRYVKREADSALLINTALGVAHLAIIFLIIAGNVGGFFSKKQGEAK